MNKLALSLLLFISFTVTSLAQSTFGLKPFDEINVSGNIELIVQEGDEEKISFSTEGVSEDKLNVTTKNGILKLRISNGVYKKSQKAYVTITYKVLRAIKASAGSQITANNSLLGDKLEFRTHSGATMELEVEVNSVEAGAFEGGKLTLTGQVGSSKVTANTGGTYNGRNLESDRVYVKSSTGGQATVSVTNSLDAKASLGGEIDYYGNPQELNRSTSLGGEINRRGGS